MAGNADFINILREIRGSAAPGEIATDGIWYELTQADTNGNAGIYGDILAKYGIVVDGSLTLERAVDIIENLNVEVTTLGPNAEATSILEDGVWKIGIPRGKDGVDGYSGLTPIPVFTYNELTGNLEYSVTYVTGSDPIVEEW